MYTTLHVTKPHDLLTTEPHTLHALQVDATVERAKAEGDLPLQGFKVPSGWWWVGG